MNTKDKNIFDYSEESLFTALCHQDLEFVKQYINKYIKHGRDINCRIDDSTGLTAISFALDSGIEFIQLLISLGFDPTLKNSDGTTALSLAIDKELLEIASYLVDCGVTANIETQWDKDSSLHIAASYKDNRFLRVLLKSGYSKKINQFNASLESPLMIAAKYGLLNNIKLLIQAGAYINLENDFGETVASESATWRDLEVHNYLLTFIE